jgi:hypothetical protein
MSDSFELMFLSILGMFSFGIACFISSCDCSALSKRKECFRIFSASYFYVLSFCLLFPIVFKYFG